MNSFILSSLVRFFKGFGIMFRNSGIYWLLMKIYNGISASWKNSGIMTLLRRNECDGASNKTAAAKVIYCPFTFLSFLKRKIGGFIENNIAQSCICNWAKIYIQSFMAVNTRFFGIMLLGAAIGCSAGGMHISKLALIAGAAGALMCVFNYNLMGFLNPSKFVDLLKSAAGFRDLSFDFFDESVQKGRARLVIALLCGIVSGIVMSMNKLYGAAIPVALFCLFLVLYAPVTGVFMAVFAAPFVPTMALAGLCVWTAVSLVIKSVIQKDFKWRFDGIGMSIALFLGVMLISSVMSFARIGSLKVWAMYFVFAGFYFVIVNTVRTKEQLYAIIKVLIISGALVALYGVMQYVFGWTTSNAWIDEEMFEDSTMRVYSTLGNPNVLGEYLLLIIPVAAVYMLKFRWKELSKWTYALMTAVLALCLILTQSRGCWIGFMISVVIFVTFYEGKWWGLIPVVLCILPFVIPQTIADRIMSVGNMEDTSTSYRVYIWLGTLGMMRHYWLGGIGMGEAAFSQVYPFFSYNAIIAPHSHNLFLQLLVEAGISGLAVFIALQAVFLKKMSVVYRANDKKSESSMLALAIASGVIGFLAQSMFDYTFYNYRVMAVFFMVIAIGASMKHIIVPSEGSTE